MVSPNYVEGAQTYHEVLEDLALVEKGMPV